MKSAFVELTIPAGHWNTMTDEDLVERILMPALQSLKKNAQPNSESVLYPVKINLTVGPHKNVHPTN